jgi:hypothetical protein
MGAGYSNAINYNLFSLFEGYVIILQFRNWGVFGGTKWKYPFLQWTNLIVWLITTLFNHNGFNSYYIIGHSVLIVVLSINMVNDLLFTRHRSLLRQPKFLICMAFIILFTYTIMVEALWIFGINQSHTFRVHVLVIMSYINCLTNLVFALAILWMPMKRTYIFQSL